MDNWSGRIKAVRHVETRGSGARGKGVKIVSNEGAPIPLNISISIRKIASRPKGGVII